MGEFGNLHSSLENRHSFCHRPSLLTKTVSFLVIAYTLSTRSRFFMWIHIEGLNLFPTCRCQVITSVGTQNLSSIILCKFWAETLGASHVFMDTALLYKVLKPSIRRSTVRSDTCMPSDTPTTHATFGYCSANFFVHLREYKGLTRDCSTSISVRFPL